MEVEIWSDVLCPFCYIGKHKFEKALQQFAHQSEVQIVWKSFQLDPDFQANKPTEYAPYLQNRKGWSKAQTDQLLGQVTETARQAGLVFHFEKAMVANSYQAHRLLHLAKEEGKQTQLKEALLKAHFSEGQDIGDIATLTTLALAVGLEESKVTQLWQSQDKHEEVETDIYEATQLGIRGVPFFVFDRKYAVSGAQDSEVFLQVLEKAYQG
jgi:predicted DsbA family dithiol-disulfide isomerase